MAHKTHDSRKRARATHRGRRAVTLGLDFDGTMVTHDFPAIGTELPLAVETVQELIGRGWDVVLFTTRSGNELAAAVTWCEERFALYDVNNNPRWPSNGSKPAFDLVIDDVALGAPLDERGHIDWLQVRELLGL